MEQKESTLDISSIALTICVIIVIAGVFFYSLSSSTESEKPNPAQLEKEAKAKQARLIQQRNTIYQKRLKDGEVERKSEFELETSQAETKAGLRKRSVSLGSKGVLFEMLITTAPKCMFGDIDLIDKDMAHSKGSKLLFSIESLSDQQNFEPIVEELSLNQLKSAKSITFSIPASENFLHLGIFLCKDSSDNGSCRSKQPMDFQHDYDAYAEADAKMARAANKDKAKKDLETLYQRLSNDKIYYFSHLSLNEREAVSLHSQASDKNYESLESYLRDSGLNRMQAQALAKRSKWYNRLIKSVPLNFSSERITIVLPRFSPTACKAQKG